MRNNSTHRWRTWRQYPAWQAPAWQAPPVRLERERDRRRYEAIECERSVLSAIGRMDTEDLSFDSYVDYWYVVVPGSINCRTSSLLLPPWLGPMPSSALSPLMCVVTHSRVLVFSFVYGGRNIHSSSVNLPPVTTITIFRTHTTRPAPICLSVLVRAPVQTSPEISVQRGWLMVGRCPDTMYAS